MTPTKIRIRTSNGKVEFKHQFPYIRRSTPFEIVVGKNDWDGSVEELQFNKFRSYRFNSGTKNWNVTTDTLLTGPNQGIVITGPTPLKGNRTETFPASATQCNLRGWRHRLIEFDLTVKRPGQAPVTIDPAWDEKP